MSKVGSWSITPASNNATPPDGWPEGQAPSTVNDCAREMMAQIRIMINDLGFVDLGMVPTRTASNTFTVTGNQTSFLDIGRRVKAFDASTLYGSVISSSFTTNTGITLRMDSGILTTSLSSFAIGTISPTNPAIPLPFVSQQPFNGNGRLDFWQRGTSFNLSASNSIFICDRFAYKQNASSSINITRSEKSATVSNVPTLAQCGQNLKYSICISVSAVDAALAGSDYAKISTPIQGIDWAIFGHKPFVVQFWAKTNRTGTYCLAVRNGGPDMCFVNEYTLSSTSWEKKTILIPEAPTTGTWNYNDSLGIGINWTLAAGATYQTNNRVWTSSIALATSNQLNFLGSAGHTFRLACIGVVPGISGAIDIAYYPANEEFSNCQRFFEKSYGPDIAPGTATSIGAICTVAILGSGIVHGAQFAVQKSGAQPTVILYKPSNGGAGQIENFNATTAFDAISVSMSPNGIGSINLSAAPASNQQLFYHYTVESEIPS